MSELPKVSASGFSAESILLRQRRRAFTTSVVLLVAAFGWPLFQLLRYSISSELYSYIPLIPLISAYLAWTNRAKSGGNSEPKRDLAIGLFCGGILVLLAFLRARSLGAAVEVEDYLAYTTLAFVLLIVGIFAWFLNETTIRSMAFPLALLALMVPLPVLLRSSIESSLQFGSAYAALGLFNLAGMPVFYNDLTFQLRDITLQVAPECSGIHSSVALFVTSLVAGHFFLRSNWRRALLAFAVIPLGMLRNGFRIFTLGELCVHVGREMIDSWIHHKGGPVFFALSLPPLLLLLYLLIKSERRQYAVLSHSQ